VTDIAALTIGSTVIVFFIYYLYRYANCFKGVFCGSGATSLRVSINSLFRWHIAAYLFLWLQFPHFLLYA